MSPNDLRRSLSLVGRAAADAFDALVPASCVGCGRGVGGDGAPLCGICRSRLPRLPLPRCMRCAEPLGNLYEATPGFDRCGMCESWPAGLVAADAPFHFEGHAATVVRALKYRGWRSLGPWMAETMAGSVQTVRARLGEAASCAPLVPVPLSPARLRERGFNQAEELVLGLARLGAGEPCRALERAPGGGRQAKAGGVSRRANVRGRFGPRRGPAERGSPAILIDDVLTTGSTAIACAEALVEAGFSRVAVVSFARTLRSLGSGDPTPPAGRGRATNGRNEPEGA